MSQARKKISIIWYIGSAIVFFTILLQIFMGKYGDKSQEAWEWFFPTVLPTLSMITVVVFSSTSNSSVKEVVSLSKYRLALSLSVMYMIVIGSTIFLSPVAQTTSTQITPLELMRLSNLWLGPLQGIVCAAIGIFFLAQR